MKKGSELLRWLFKSERPGCLAYPLWLLFIVGPLLPIIPIAGIEHDGIKEPSTLYIVSTISAPVIMLILLGVTGRQTTLSRAYFLSFVLVSVLSIVYLGCKFYAHKHNYGYMGHDLITALVLTPLYLAAVSLLFLIMETIAKRSAGKKKEHFQRLRPFDGPRNTNRIRK